MKTNLEILLGEWGRWQAGMNRTGLGYPSTSAFTQERVQSSANRDNLYVLMADDDMRRVDCAIAKLYPDMRSVIIAHYVGTGPVKVKAHRLGISIRVYYSTLEFAEKQLAHAMSGHYATGYEPKVCAHIAEMCA